MQTITLEVAGVSKSFNRKSIFSEISFTLHRLNSLAVTGRNGSGKSTLLKILAGVMSPSKGTVSMLWNNQNIPSSQRMNLIGFVAPYLQLYDEFTAWENLLMFRKIRGVENTDDDLHQLIKRMNLHERKNDLVRTFSSGMKQRLKYTFALVHRPPILYLDEPTVNLDQEGTALVHQIIEEQKHHGILIIATNEKSEVSFCDNVLDLDDDLKTLLKITTA